MQASIQIHASGESGTMRRTPNRIERFIGDRLTRSRVRFTAAATIVVASLLLLFSFATTVDNRTATGLGLGSDYLAFYNAGTIVNRYSLDRLYDLNLQAELYHANLPGEPAHTSLPYANAPFLAILLRPLALLPYSWSYATWIGLSVALFAAAFAVVWNVTGLPKNYRSIALLFALSFEPFLIECLHGGQISAFGLLWLSLAIHFSLRGREWHAGMALAVCLYKPTLLPLILPMLMIMRQWRTLGGFIVGSLLLAAISLASAGSAANIDYLCILFGYFTKTAGAGSAGLQTFKFIDLNSFLKLLGIPSLMAWTMLMCVGILVLRAVCASRPGTQAESQRTLPLAWAAAITWTLVLNVYVGVYDAVLIVPSIVLTCGALIRRRSDTGRNLPLRLRCLFLAIWILPWFSGLIARDFGFQPFTLALLTLGMYQLQLLRRRAATANGAEPARPSRRLSDAPRGAFAAA